MHWLTWAFLIALTAETLIRWWLGSRQIAAVLAPVPEAKELVQLKVSHSVIKRDGRWVVPRRLEVEARHGNVILDFSDAIISQPTLDLSISVAHGNMVLIVPPGVLEIKLRWA